MATLKKYDYEILKEIDGRDKEILKKLREIYKEAAKEISLKISLLMTEGIQSKLYQAEFQKKMLEEIEIGLSVLENKEIKTIDEFFRECYENGWCSNFYSLNKQGVPYFEDVHTQRVLTAINNTKLKGGIYDTIAKYTLENKNVILKEVTVGMAMNLSYDEISNRIYPTMNISKNKISTVVRTEGHRIYNEASYEAMSSASKYADIYKQWCATLDERTRESHQILDGEMKPFNESFSNGLMYPGDRNGKAEEVINCRCTLLQRAKWALTKEDLNTWEKRSDYYGLTEAKDFREYKKLLTSADV